MKKIISFLLVVLMLFTPVSAYAESAQGRFEGSDILNRFLTETDTAKNDILMRLESGDESTDLVIRVDRDTVHMVSRRNGVEDRHAQLSPAGLYLAADGTVTMLRYATVTTAMQDLVKAADSMLEQQIQSIPPEAVPSELEIKKAINQLTALAMRAEAQEQADAVTLTSAAMSFASKFKPENILDVQGENGSLEISLRSYAYASAMAEAMDEMMSNPALADLVNRRAAANGGETFAELQRDWLQNREAVLEAISSVESTEKVEQIGQTNHWVSHFKIGDKLSEENALMCDTDAWINAESNEAVITNTLGFADKDPLMVYELEVSPYSYSEKLTSGDSRTETQLSFKNNMVNSGKAVTVIEDNETLRMDFGPDYMYMWSPNGSLSTTVRETWTGKIRYEVIGETAEGKESRTVIDFYQEDDSLVCDMYDDDSDDSATFRISRIDKTNIEDLSASKNIREITADQLDREMGSLMGMVIRTQK